jgi:hypothetical protein
MAEIRRVLRNAARECAEIVDGERTVGTGRRGMAFVLAMRPWNYSGFRQFERIT